MLEPIATYISSSWLKPLWAQLQKIHGERQREIERIQNEFCDPCELARYYVEPDCQHHNPADRWEDEEPRAQVKSPVFKTINDFLTGEFAVTRTGKNQMFILSDAGMGKSSLLVMLRLTGFWPPQHHCELLKLGPDTLNRLHPCRRRDAAARRSLAQRGGAQRVGGNPPGNRATQTP